MKILKIASAIILVIGLIILLSTKSCSNKDIKPKTEIKKTVLQWIVIDRKTILLTKEYGETYLLPNPDRPNGIGFDLLDSNKPYCSANANGDEACGEAGENISPKLPKNSDANSRLRFKLRDGYDSNGQGQVTLLISKLTEVEVK